MWPFRRKEMGMHPVSASKLYHLLQEDYNRVTWPSMEMFRKLEARVARLEVGLVGEVEPEADPRDWFPS